MCTVQLPASSQKESDFFKSLLSSDDESCSSTTSGVGSLSTASSDEFEVLKAHQTECKDEHVKSISKDLSFNRVCHAEFC